MRRRDVARDVLALSAGTIASLTGRTRYEDVGAIQLALFRHAQAHAERFDSWRDAWRDFARTVLPTFGDPV